MGTYNLRKELIRIAAREAAAKVREIPLNSNTGARVREYQQATNLRGTGWPWCAAFVCWCIREWGKIPDVRDALAKIHGIRTDEQFEKWRPKTAAAYGFDEWGRKNGLLVINENEEPGKAILHTGDIVTFDTSHVGLLGDDQKNTLFTVEGNTDSAGSREGGGVYEKTRQRSFVRTVIRIFPE